MLKSLGGLPIARYQAHLLNKNRNLEANSNLFHLKVWYGGILRIKN